MADSGPPPLNPGAHERRIAVPRGTRDRLPGEQAQLREIETRLLETFRQAGYELLATPVVEFSELHERKSGAAIVGRLAELADTREGRLCLRPELTAGVVRALAAQPEPPAMPWRVSVLGPVFRWGQVRPGHDRQFTQIGVEHLGGPAPVADAEVIAVASRAVQQLGLPQPTIRIGHVGLIIEMLRQSGLPRAAQSSLVEILSEAASVGQDIRSIDRLIERLSVWLRSAPADADRPGAEPARGSTDPEVARLFDHLVPNVAGRRSGPEIMERIYRKWELGLSLRAALERIHEQVETLAQLRGSASEVLERLKATHGTVIPTTVAELEQLVQMLQVSGIDPTAIVVDMGFSRGIGFYSQMVFDLMLQTPGGPIEIGGGGRYDGLASVLGSSRDSRGVGFAFGVERLDQAMRALNVRNAAVALAGGTLVVAPPEGLIDAAGLLRELRSAEPEGLIVGPELQTVEDSRALEWAQQRAGKLGCTRLILVRPRADAGKQGRTYELGESGWVEAGLRSSNQAAGTGARN